MSVTKKARKPKKTTTPAAQKSHLAKYQFKAKKNPAKATAVKSYKPRRKRNPSNIPTILQRPLELLKAGAVAAIAYAATRQLPQWALGARNTSYMGYGANFATALLLTALADKVLGSEAGKAAFAGGGAYCVARIADDQTPLGATLNLQGVGDSRALGGIVPGYFASPAIVDRKGNPIIPQAIIDAAVSAMPRPVELAPRAAAAGVGRFANRL